MFMRVLNSSCGLICVCSVVSCVVMVWWCSWLCFCSICCIEFLVCWCWLNSFSMVIIIVIGMKLLRMLFSSVIGFMLFIGGRFFFICIILLMVG